MTTRSSRKIFIYKKKKNRDPLRIWKQEPWHNEDVVTNYERID